ncbi:tungstate transport system substrate-binding protein [Caloramator quimbayensis]|uniref:Tungstate transport system substrate-binding protein n=1 Tax=Caloramator quimbayensis TaxID=1147123 RepID=A0A1T4Y0J4_9CLOT|nr:extracellular solute-binding protein [Caloramator quimbayensis]SKA94998.1 tungstate transport system substrate-binding protein [Caloramator quimbayensis]
MKKNLTKFFYFSVIFIFCLSFLSCTSVNEKSFILATTTSTQDSGLLDYILPVFEKETGIKVKVVAKGTGEALEMGKRGDADCLLVHAKSKEEQFVNDGYALKRYDVMYNDFVIVGPKEDRAQIKSTGNDPLLAFKKIYENKVAFISRGDESGTHTKEKEIWKKLNINIKGEWYISAGTGMGAVLKMADEKKAYTLTDRATYLSMKDKISLVILVEKNPILYNQYGIMMVNPKKHKIKEKEVQTFIDWILSDKTQKLIGEYGRDKYGQSLFIPNAKK